jgi:hypothetical protein
MTPENIQDLEGDQLPSWRETPATRSILDLVAAVTTPRLGRLRRGV